MNTYTTPYKLNDFFLHPTYGLLQVKGTQSLPEKIFTVVEIDGAQSGLLLNTSECKKQVLVSEELHLMLKRYYDLSSEDIFTSNPFSSEAEKIELEVGIANYINHS